MPELTCPCGAQFHAPPSAVARGRKFCSPSCYHRLGEIATGDRKPLTWKGDAVGYAALHDWVRRQRGAPERCESCGTTAGRLEWANISREYRRDVADWMALCKPCHGRYDNETCRRGHDRTAANTWVDRNGYPHCRPCRNERLRLQRRGRRSEWDEQKRQSGSAVRKKFGAPAGV
jgi:hypothetical protein